MEPFEEGDNLSDEALARPVVHYDLPHPQV